MPREIVHLKMSTAGKKPAVFLYLLPWQTSN